MYSKYDKTILTLNRIKYYGSTKSIRGLTVGCGISLCDNIIITSGFYEFYLVQNIVIICFSRARGDSLLLYFKK